ncbi:MAG TPA: aminotransferase class I/II-fold pyridoxal phosphate-dependent enzyme, partial [Opitutaceae bacterium]|nr:aminotransferase class I/II-fold pyridoxal phosphate-dependent enzyme [Opitutaceae bacterium]
WRVGYLCAPRPVAELALRMHQYTMLCAPHVSQLAAVEALLGASGEVDDMVADYDRRRRVFVKGLREIGLECPEPGGAFYAFPSIRVSGLDSATFAQYGALAALQDRARTSTALAEMLAAFDRRRKFLHAELNRIPGIRCLLAQGAFYLFPNISSFGLSSQEFCARLLEKERVAAVPGSAFGAEGYLRLSYATSDAVIAKGVERLARFCASL